MDLVQQMYEEVREDSALAASGTGILPFTEATAPGSGALSARGRTRSRSPPGDERRTKRRAMTPAPEDQEVYAAGDEAEVQRRLAEFRRRERERE